MARRHMFVIDFSQFRRFRGTARFGPWAAISKGATANLLGLATYIALQCRPPTPPRADPGHRLEQGLGIGMAWFGK